MIGLQKLTLFLRAANESLREELENALELLEPGRMDLTSDWSSLEKAVTKVSNRHRRQELDKEAVFERPPSPESKSESKTKEERKAEPSVAVEDLSELMRNLTILTTQFVETKG
ncbi:unnamed protein product [Calypogeia fissa]